MPTFIPVATRAEAREAARQHLKNNPNLTGGNLYELPDGTKIRVRQKEGGRLSAESYDTKTKADTKRGQRENTYTTDEAATNAAAVKEQARQQSDSTLHQYIYGNRPSIGEHNRGLQAGGIGDDLESVSDPEFKVFKDTAESKIYGRYGDKYIVDVNEVTGYLRVIPRSYYNQYQNRSTQPGFDLEPHMDLDQVVTGLPFIVAQNLGLTNTEFPTEQQPGLQTTAGKAQWKPPALPGFDTSEQPGPTVTAPQGGGYYAPQVMEANGNGANDTNGNGTNGQTPPVTIEPPTNGNGGNGNGVDYTAQNVQQLFELGKQLSDASLTIRAGKAVWGLVKTAGLVAGSYALK